MGLIIRTVAKGVSREELLSDLQYLLRTWDSIRQRYALAKKPTLLYREADLVMRMVRDHFTADVKQVVVDSREAYERICQVSPVRSGRAASASMKGTNRFLNTMASKKGSKA